MREICQGAKSQEHINSLVNRNTENIDINFRDFVNQKLSQS